MGACSSRPKTAEFEGNVHFYTQEEMARKHLDDDQNSGYEAGLKSMDPKPAEIEQNMNLYLQNGMATKNLENDQKRGSDADLKSIDPVQKISSQCSLPNLKLGMQNEDGMGVTLLESGEEHLAGSNHKNNGQDTCTRAAGNRDAKHKSVAEGESLVPEISTSVVELQNKKKSVVQELYEEPAFPQKEVTLGSCENWFLFEGEVVVELPLKVALKDAENGKFQTIKKGNEERKLPSFEARKPRIDAEEGDLLSGKARQEPISQASRVSEVDFNLRINPAGNLTNCRTENAAPCPANGFMLLHNDKSRDTFLKNSSKTYGPAYGAQEKDLKNSMKGQSAPLTQDNARKNLNLIVTSSNGSLTVKENHVDYVIPPALISLPELSALSNKSLRVVGIKVDESSCIDILPSVLNSDENKIPEKAHITTGMCDEPPCQSPKFAALRAKCSGSADEKSGVHEIEKPLVSLVNTKVEDSLMAWDLVGNEASDMILSKDGTQFGSQKGGKVKFSTADTNESIFRAALDSQTASLFKVCREANCFIQGEEYASKHERNLIFCSDEIKVSKADDTSKERVIDYGRHSTASQPPKTFQELRSMSVGGKDMASDIDEVLEKLASEFERQESLSSFAP